MTQPPPPKLEDDPGFRRLLRYLSLSDRFLLALVHAHIPLASTALLAALPEALSQRRGQPVRLVCHDPYQDRPEPNAPLEQETALQRVLWPLSEGPAEDRARGVLQVIDGSRFLLQDTPAWTYLFARMNEQRNAITQKLSCELLLLGSPQLLDLFARTAPDFWSIRSGEFCEDLTLNRPPPVSLAEFLAARSRIPPLPKGVSPPLLEAYIEFTKLPDPSPDDFLLTSLLRDPWRKLGQAIQLVHQGNLNQASLLAQLLSELEALPLHSGFSPIPSYFFALHLTRLYSVHTDYQTTSALASMTKLYDALEADSLAIGHLSSFCMIQTRLLQVLYQQRVGDIARAHQSEQETTNHLSSLDATESPTTWKQLGDILYDVGEVEAAVQAWQTEAKGYRQQGEDYQEAQAWGKIGNILEARGQLDDALAIRQERELPVYQRLGAAHEEAITWGRIGDILDVRGELDKALAIRHQKQLPVYQRLGDVREEAATWGKIGDILEARGQLDDALAIRQERELPVYQRLGAAHEEAITWGRISSILQKRDQLDEAMAIWRQRVLPVFQRIGDVREEVIAWSKISDILEKRNQLDEALAIRQERVLPIFQRLGSAREEAIAWSKISDIFQKKDQLNRALNILLKRVIPVYKRLGVRQDLLVGQTKLAQLFLRRAQGSDREQAKALLDEALASAERMKLPEAEQIKEIMRQHGWPPPGG